MDGFLPWGKIRAPPFEPRLRVPFHPRLSQIVITNYCFPQVSWIPVFGFDANDYSATVCKIAINTRPNHVAQRIVRPPRPKRAQAARPSSARATVQKLARTYDMQCSMRAARALLVLAIAWPSFTKGQTCQGDACPVLPQRVAARLVARLSDEELAATIIELLAACDGREECALSMEQGAVAAASNGHPLDGVDDERAAAAEVKGLDTWLPGTGFRLLFGTPFFSTTLDGVERMNDELAALVHREQASAVASQQRSMSGGSSFRTDDHFLTRPEPAVRHCT